MHIDKACMVIGAWVKNINNNNNRRIVIMFIDTDTYPYTTEIGLHAAKASKHSSATRMKGRVQ